MMDESPLWLLVILTMKFTEALILFCLLAAGLGVVAFFSPMSSVQFAEKIFYLGFGFFSCWLYITPQLFGRLCRFLKSIPRCWAESKETSK